MKLSRVAILTFALPASLAAQQPQPNQQGGPMTTVLRNRTMTFQRNLAQAFDSIPESKFGYKPTPAQMTVGDIVDLADHYSQIANYMRLNGMLPPTALPRPPAR